MKAAIEKIMILERIRKEITRIPELAADIKKNGLLNTVTVMPLDGGELRLLAGLRRIKAAQSLGWTEIDVNVVTPSDAETILNIEYSENEQRENFTYSEKMDYSQLIDEIEKAKARERMLVGKNLSDPVDARPQGQGKTRDIIGGKIGMSGRQYDRAKYVATNAQPEDIEQIDNGERTVYEVYKELRAKEKTAEPEPDKTPEESAAKSKTPPKSNTPPKFKAETSSMKLPSDSRTAKNDPFFQKLKAEEAEAIRKREEFEAMPPEEKIAELQRQIKEWRVRAVTAESDLETLKTNHGITIDHKDSIIESLKLQNAQLNAALTEANKRIAELEIS